MCRTALSFQFCSLVQDVTHIGRKFSENVFPNYYLWLASPLHKPITFHARNNLCVVIASFHIAFCLLKLQNIMQAGCRRFSRAIRVLKVCRRDDSYAADLFLLSIFSQYRSCDDTQESISFQSWKQKFKPPRYLHMICMCWENKPNKRKRSTEGIQVKWRHW